MTKYNINGEWVLMDSLFVQTPKLRTGMHNSKAIYAGDRVCIPAATSLKKTDIIKVFSLLMEGIDITPVDSADRLLVTLKGHNPTFGKVSLEEAQQILKAILAGGMKAQLHGLEVYDGPTYMHSLAVAALSILVGEAMGMSRYELEQLAVAAMLHDIGKQCIPHEIIIKADELDDDEIEVIRQHPFHGLQLVKDFPGVSYDAKIAIYQHHENEDGTGYPAGLQGGKITTFAKIIHVCDVYDALTSVRPYRQEPLSAEQGLGFIISNSGGMFDRYITEVFKEICTHDMTDAGNM